MDRDPVVHPDVVDRQRDVVLDVERPVGVVGADAGQAQALGLVAGVEVVLRVVDRVEPDHALVDVGPGEVHHVVVEPEEALLLPAVVAGRPVQVQLVHEGLDREAVVLRAEQERVVRVAVRLRRGVRVVQVGQEPELRVPEVLPGQVERVLVQVVAEPDQRRLAVLGVDHRTRERAVEPVDRARRQRSHGPGREGVSVRVERLGRLAQRVDRQHLRGGERVLRDLHLDVVDDRVREPDRVHPQLVGLVAERVLLTHARARRRRQRRHLRRAERLGRLQDRQRVVERVEDQRRDRERLDVERLGDRLRRRPENAVRAEESPLLPGTAA